MFKMLQEKMEQDQIEIRTKATPGREPGTSPMDIQGLEARAAEDTYRFHPPPEKGLDLGS